MIIKYKGREVAISKVSGRYFCYVHLPANKRQAGVDIFLDEFPTMRKCIRAAKNYIDMRVTHGGRIPPLVIYIAHPSGERSTLVFKPFDQGRHEVVFKSLGGNHI